MSNLKKLSQPKNSRKIIPEQIHFSLNSPVYIPLFLADRTLKIQAVWQLELENGKRDSGKVKRNRIQLSNLPKGIHKLILIVGKPLLLKSASIYQCQINIS
ncbi:hypothetical protein [Mannheimia varigena]|uniref:hypothetical protein n=1 Tax=Mannheimia varigena TaxID=85404 RepID=UPI00046CB2EA|nr:hypothetical protein [Mannheimia varigena]